MGRAASILIATAMVRQPLGAPPFIRYERCPDGRADPGVPGPGRAALARPRPRVRPAAGLAAGFAAFLAVRRPGPGPGPPAAALRELRPDAPDHARGRVLADHRAGEPASPGRMPRPAHPMGHRRGRRNGRAPPTLPVRKGPPWPPSMCATGAAST